MKTLKGHDTETLKGDIKRKTLKGDINKDTVKGDIKRRQ